jgi:NAD(P)-dependent dehydrogenase (short-subunit alcohol dehydrogenase family)
MGLISVFPTLPAIPDETTFAEKSILITGANIGIGFQCARSLLLLNASTLYLAVRSVEKGYAAREALLSDKEIAALSIKPIIEIYELDLADYTKTVTFASKFTAEVKKLDIAILNAGIFQVSHGLSPSGNEYELQVNFLSNSLLALYLHPLLAQSGTPANPSVLTFVNSMAHALTYTKPPYPKTADYPGGILTAFNAKESFSATTGYNISKIFALMWIREWSSKAPEPKHNVIINAVCPGYTQSNLDNSMPFPLRHLLVGIRALIGRTTEQGGQAYILVLLVGQGSHGTISSNGRITE